MKLRQKAEPRALHILYIGEDTDTFKNIQTCLADAPHYTLLHDKTAVSGRLTLAEIPVGVILYELPNPLADHLAELTTLYQEFPDKSFILLADEADINAVGQIAVTGEYDYLCKTEIAPSPLYRALRYANDRQHLRTELALINQISRQLISTLDLTLVLKTALEEVRRLLDVMACSIWLYDQETDELVCRQVAGPGSDVILGWRLAKEQGIVGWVAAHGHPLIIRDTWADSRHYHNIDETTGLPIRSTLCLPLQTKQKVLGVLQLVDKEVGSFVEANLALLEPLATAAAIAIDNAHLYQQAQQEIAERKRAEDALRNRNRELGRLYQASNALLPSANPDLSRLAQAIVSTVQREFHKANCSLVLVQPGEDRLNRVAVSGPYAAEVRNMQLSLSGPGIVPEVIRTGRLLSVPDVFNQPRYQAGWAKARSELAIPLTIGDQVIGAIDVQSEELADFNQEDERLLTYFASRAALALQSARLFEETRRWAVELEQRVADRTEALKEANEQLRQALQVRDEFLASMSHELRTPLNAILLRCELMMGREMLSPDQTRSIQIIQESGEHLLDLINDVLDVAKIEAGKLDVTVEPVAVQPVCESSLRMVQNLASAKQLEVVEEYAETAVFVQADQRRLKQILVNLLSNAVKFTPEGRRIGLKVQDDLTSGRVQFVVWDEGIGIAEGDQPRLFQPFVQIDGSLARQYGGTGLGLTLVERLVGLQQGHIQVESILGQGSRFMVSLPRFDPAGAADEASAEEETAVASTLPSLHSARAANEPATILLAEDNEAVIEVLSEFLVLQGHTLLIARNGHEAVALAVEQNPDLILMDIQMPGMDGLEAIRQIRSKMPGSPMGIIALTALVMAGDRERCLAAGADAYVSKPIGFIELSKIIEERLNATIWKKTHCPVYSS